MSPFFIAQEAWYINFKYYEQLVREPCKGLPQCFCKRPYLCCLPLGKETSSCKTKLVSSSKPTFKSCTHGIYFDNNLRILKFWNTAHSQTVNDVKQIHATVDGKTVVISESSVRSDLHFNDEDGITCLTNDAIFENLALMGYESDSNKLTFQKALFSPQWKYLIHTILHCLSSKSTSWNEFSTNIASAVICLANGQKFNFSKLIFDGMLRNLDTNTKKFLMYPRFLQLFLNNQITLAEPFNDVYQTPAHTKKVFTNMKRKGKDFSGRVTPLFASMLAPPVVEGEGSGQPSEPQPAPSTAQPRIEEQIPVTESSSPQNTQLPRQALQEDTQFPQTSVPIPNVADEAVFKEWDDRVVRATTTAASLDAAQASGDRPRCQEAMGGVIAQTRSERASKHSYDSPLPGGNTPGSDEERIEQDDLMDFVPPTPHDSPLSGGHTPGSDEGRPNINELMAICTNLSNRVLALEQSKTAQDLVIRKLKKKVRKLEKKLRARTPGMKLFKIGTSKRKSLDEEYVSKQGRKSDKTKPMFDDSDFAELDVDNAMENVEGDAKTQGRNTAEQTTTTTGDTVNTASIDVSAAGPSNVSTADPSTSTAGDIFEDEMMTIVDTLVAIRSTRPRTTSVVIRDVEEEPRRATPVLTGESQDKGKGKMVEPEPTPKNPIKAQIQKDAEIAQRLHEKKMLNWKECKEKELHKKKHLMPL
ncbi:hypothetical protein Tco_0974979 [Tanacetum coccineum]|uniref:Synaptobrevin, longin-like domain protein n=1 Tax=Tanacetum coccineum TaxID=301880 RepID=A0ABQ5EE91_9ASTR